MKRLLLPALLGCATVGAHAQISVLHTFTGADGAWARGSLTLGDGVLYGRTSLGGTNNSGTIFSIGTDGSGFDLMYSFTSDPNDGLGMMPHHNAMLLVGSTLYGAALYGGNLNNPQPPSSPSSPPPPVYPKAGNGTLFSIQTDGTGYTVLKALDGWGDSPPATGSALSHSPFLLSGNTAYGMTSNGGSSHNEGSLYSFSLTDPEGTYEIIHAFKKSTGAEPHGMVIFDSTGDSLLGMTRKGGELPGSGDEAFGVVFSYNLTTSDYTVLHTFTGETSDGATNDHGFLTLIGSRVYGLTSGGGEENLGVIFSMNEDGSDFSLLHSFGDPDYASDGTVPYGSLTLLNGVLYGTTTKGGLNDAGTVFSIYADGSGYATLGSFDMGTTGGLPEDFLTANADGTMLYGMTQTGGVNDPTGVNYYGTVFAFPAIPEPSAIALLGAGAVLFMLRKRYV